MTTATLARPAWPTFLRLAVTFLALCTFTIQTCVVQTHLHGLGTQSGIVTSAAPVVKTPHDQRNPFDGDPASCQICQEFLHAGAFVLPAVIAALPPTAVVSQIAVASTPQTASKRTSHNWMGRAPPQA